VHLFSLLFVFLIFLSCRKKITFWAPRLWKQKGLTFVEKRKKRKEENSEGKH
jgi:hypothetical protein